MSSKPKKSTLKVHSGSASGAVAGTLVSFLKGTKADVLAGVSVAAGGVVIGTSGVAAVPLGVVIPAIAAAKLVLSLALKLIEKGRIVADDEDVKALFERVTKEKRENIKEVRVVACTEKADCALLKMLGSVNTNFCHDYLLVEVTTFVDGGDSTVDDEVGVKPTRKDRFELHFLYDDKLHIHTPKDERYQVDGDRWYDRKGVPVEFVADEFIDQMTPKDLLVKAVEHAFHFVKQNKYDIQRYNCQSFVKTIVKSIHVGKYHKVVDPTVRFWKAFADGWMRATGVYDKASKTVSEIAPAVAGALYSVDSDTDDEKSD